MAKQEIVELLVRLKNELSQSIKAMQGDTTTASTGIKKSMEVVRDSFKSSMFSAVALGTAITQFAMSAISGIKQWVKDTKEQFMIFNSTLSLVYTQLDKNAFEKFHKELEKGAIDIIQKYNFSIQDVNKSMFDAVSAGIDAGNAIEFMNEAARLAKGGAATLTSSVSGLVAIINSYGLEQTEANKVADAFFTAQKFGKMNVEELATSIGKVAPIARAAGMSYQEVMAALAQLTLAGLSTDEAVTALKGTLTSIISPGKENVKLFNELGIPIGEAAFKGEKFGETMEKIKNSTEGNIDVIAALIPNIRGLLGVTTVATKEGLQKYDDILREVKTDHEGLNGAVEVMTRTLEDQIATEKNKLLPTKLQMGKILANLELGYLRLANSAMQTGTVFEQSFGVYGRVVNYMSKMAEKIALITGLHKEEASEDAKKAKAYIDNLLARNEMERETLEEKAEIKIEDLERGIEIDQEFLEQQAQLTAAAEEVRIEFENQKKLFDQMSAEQRLKLLNDTLGKERVLKTSAEVNELERAGKHAKAKEKMEELYQDAFFEMNKKAIADLDASWRKHWDYQVASAVLGRKMTKDEYEGMHSVFKDVMYLMGKESVAAFRVMQGVAIAETIVNTVKAAQSAFAAMAGIPPAPFWGFAAATTASLAGAARVDEIRRQQPPQAETGAYVKHGGLAELHDQEMVLNREQTKSLAAGSVQHIYLQLNRETLQKWVVAADAEAQKMENMGMR